MLKITLTFILLAACFITVTGSGCGKKADVFGGNVYFHDADSLAYIAGFDNDTLYYIIRGPKQNMSHKSKYSVTKKDDTTFTITLTDKPPFWEKETWDVVLKDKGFYSAESKNYYQYSADKNILR